MEVNHLAINTLPISAESLQFIGGQRQLIQSLLWHLQETPKEHWCTQVPAESEGICQSEHVQMLPWSKLSTNDGVWMATTVPTPTMLQ